MGRMHAAATLGFDVLRRWLPRVLRVLLMLSVLALGALSFIGLSILGRQGDIPPLSPQVRGMAFALAGLLLLFALWWVPRRQARALGAEASARDRGELEDRYRRTLAGIVGGVVLVLMLAGALRDSALARTHTLAGRFEGALSLLASDRAAHRIAGVYTLEVLAGASDTYRRPAYEALLAFLRERASAAAVVESLPPAPDVLAAVGVISRRAADGGTTPLRPDFSGADLRGLIAPGAWWDFARLRGSRLEGADLRGARIAGKEGSDLRGVRLDSANLMRAHLDGARLDSTSVLYHANLRRADLDGASLRGADLRRARLDSAELQGASLQRARLDSASLKWAVLDGANLTGASLTDVDLDGASLRRAKLFGTDLRAVRNLRSQQLVGALLDSTTALPPGVARPAQRPPD